MSKESDTDPKEHLRAALEAMLEAIHTKQGREVGI
jgi:hypothetical protein